MRRLENKITAVTGAGRGIGRSIAIRFAEESALVVAADLDGPSAVRTTAEIEASRGKARAHTVDVGEQTQVDELMASTVRDCARIDVLVNVAGVGLTQLFLNTTRAQWEHVLRVNLTGCFLCSQAAARVMAAQGCAKIINIASLLILRCRATIEKGHSTMIVLPLLCHAFSVR